MQFAYREALTPSMAGFAALLTAGLVVVLTVYGPFGSHYVLTLAQRLAYCAPALVLQLVICYPAFVFTLYLVRNRSQMQIVLSLGAMVLILAAPCTAIAYTAADIYRTHHSGPLSNTTVWETYVVCAALLANPTALVYYVLYQRLARPRAANDSTAPAAGSPCADPAVPGAERAIAPPAEGNADAGTAGELHRSSSALGGDAEHAAGVADIAEALDVSRPAEAPEADRSATEPSPFFSRLPAELGRDLMFLKMSGHYLDVTTVTGSAAILMRLGDAVAELGDLGMQVHRSYWVAHRHVLGVARSGNRTLLRLAGSHEVPVSRSCLPAVRRRHPN